MPFALGGMAQFDAPLEAPPLPPVNITSSDGGYVTAEKVKKETVPTKKAPAKTTKSIPKQSGARKSADGGQPQRAASRSDVAPSQGSAASAAASSGLHELG